jgi:carboxyl-terminal processing protease
MDVGEADLDYPVEFDRVPSASYSSYDFKNKTITDQLGQRSQTRLSESKDFQDVVRKVKKYVEQKELKTVSLNEKKFMARRKELNAEKEDEKAIEDQILPSNEIKRNFYLDEVLRITSDYMDLLSKNT